MATLPTYQEATARPDWLRLVAPYIDFADYRALCRVDRRCWRVFAPLLWADILFSASLSGLAPCELDSSWWPYFVFHKLAHVDPNTRSLVRVLDFRGFVKGVQGFALDCQSVLMQQSLKRALELLPDVKSLLLDGNTSIDPSFLALLDNRRARQRGLLQLSVSDCRVNLSPNFFQAHCLRDLVFLDISGLTGSLSCILRPSVLGSLRILKVGKREIDDRTGTLLANVCGRRLWSLDLSGNKLTDSIIESLMDTCLPLTDLRSAARSQVEGKLVSSGYGTQQHGPFWFIQESRWSASFSHPERYLVDAPKYRPAARTETSYLGDLEAQRSDCRSPPRLDCADPVSQLLLSDPDPLFAADHAPASRGITHLSLSNNEVSAFGIDKLFRKSGGHLSHFACSKMPILPTYSACSRVWPRSARLYGIMGKEHVFRPVYASNLQSLRLHHSIVTNIPSLEMDGLSKLARALIAETLILPRVDQAFPLALVPDTNPRLASLTLSCIPRMSSGPLIERLIGFLRLLSMQECVVQDTREMIASCRPSNVLRGLRHLRLEFEPETPVADLDVNYDDDDLDAGALLDSGDGGFSFFETNRAAAPHIGVGATTRSRSALAGAPQPADQDHREFVPHNTRWNAKTFTLQVWAGTPSLATSNAHMREYRRLVLGCLIREGVGPVTPSQVRVGAPMAGYIFQRTWSMAVMPPRIEAPRTMELANMRSVINALCEYHQQGFAKLDKEERELGKGRVPPGPPHWYWRGKLDVCLM